MVDSKFTMLKVHCSKESEYDALLTVKRKTVDDFVIVDCVDGQHEAPILFVSTDHHFITSLIRLICYMYKYYSVILFLMVIYQVLSFKVLLFELFKDLESVTQRVILFFSRMDIRIIRNPNLNPHIRYHYGFYFRMRPAGNQLTRAPFLFGTLFVYLVTKLLYIVVYSDMVPDMVQSITFGIYHPILMIIVLMYLGVGCIWVIYIFKKLDIRQLFILWISSVIIVFAMGMRT